MEPIVLIHGYSAESKESSPADIAGIYGSLPKALRDYYGSAAVVEIDVSRYVSLEDGVTVDDISRALDRALREEYPHLLNGAFHVIIHSTGALVIRNWIRRFSPRPSPIRNLIYLAGANFGSGWAHIGKGQLAQWGRMIFQGGAERGVQVLDALELGSDWTLDLHLHFLRSGQAMLQDYRVCEYVIIGTQADVQWYPVPIRYAKEDGSDGVVRVSAGNVNFNYVRFGPAQPALNLPFDEVRNQLSKYRGRDKKIRQYYEIKESSRPGVNGRPVVPLAIPYECAHSGEKMGVVIGSRPRPQVLRMLKQALAGTPEQMPDLVEAFEAETNATYDRALKSQAPAWWKKWLSEPRAQYDRHAQIIFRIRDQDGRPVKHFDIFFDALAGPRSAALPIKSLFEDKHCNGVSPNIITFYLRTDRFQSRRKRSGWEPQVPKVGGCYLDVSAVEPETEEVVYLPMRFEFDSAQLTDWIQGHRTTLIDIELLRLPSPAIFKIVPFAG